MVCVKQIDVSALSLLNIFGIFYLQLKVVFYSFLILTHDLTVVKIDAEVEKILFKLVGLGVYEDSDDIIDESVGFVEDWVNNLVEVVWEVLVDSVIVDVVMLVVFDFDAEDVDTLCLVDSEADVEDNIEVIDVDELALVDSVLN